MRVRKYLILASAPVLLMTAEIPLMAQNNPSPASDQPSAQTSGIAAVEKHGNDEDREAARAAATEAVLRLDRSRFNDWQSGNFRRFGEAVAPDFLGIAGNGAPGKQIMSKTDYLAYAQAQRPAPTVVLSGTGALLFGFESDVAIVRGQLGPDGAGAGAGSGAGEIYSSIYVEDIMDHQWQLCRVIISPLKVTSIPPAPPPGPTWSIDDLSKTQGLVVKVLQDFLAEMDGHDINGLQRTLDDNYTEIHANAQRQIGKQEYILTKSLSGGFPGLIGIDKPDVQFYGNYGDVAVIQGVRRDSDTGVVYGSEFAPHWRNVVYYIAVLQRSCAASTNSCARQHKDPNEWRMELYHATYVQTDGDAVATQQR